MFELAQINVARPVDAIDSPRLADFVAQLDTINALAEAATGFVWRLKDDSGNATELGAEGEPELIINLSVWRDVQSLRDYVYSSAHVEVMKRRREWFVSMGSAHLALWWVPAGQRPDVAHGMAALAALKANGPGPDAFSIAHPFPAPLSGDELEIGLDGFRLRPARRDDKAAIISLLESQSLPVLDLTDQSLHYFVVVESSSRGDGLLGTAALEPRGDAAILRSLVLAPSCRGQGLGKALVNALETAASARTLSGLYLLTETASEFFKSLGYQLHDRKTVPEAVASSCEFESLCPDSAQCFRKLL